MTSFVRPVLLLSLILTLVGCRREESIRTPDKSPEINVLMISLDTTRADHLACYGHGKIHTPNIDRLAAQGVLFEQCSSTASVTLPSHASMMTGLYPFSHGARDNGRFVLHDGNVTLAETLADSGYATAAQVAVFVLNRPTGMAQGFAEFFDTSDIERTDQLTPSQRLAGAGITAPINELRGDLAADGAVGWINENAERKFFLFVHLFDPHQPYEPPEPFKSRYENRYLGEIAYVDEQVGRILDALDERGVTDQTLVVLTADHGEAFEEHGVDGHSYFIYDTTIHVPLIMRLPGRIPAGRRVSHQVRLVDVAPTILDLAAANPLPNAHGVSLEPYLDSDDADLELVAYMETLSPYLDFGYSRLRGLRNDRWKYILAPTPELYDISADPGERQNVHDAHPQVAAEMRAAMHELIASSAPADAGGASTQNLTPEELARLQSLGYLGGSDGATLNERELATFEPEGADPKERIQQMQMGTAAVWAAYKRDFARAERLYRELLQSDPQNLNFLQKLGDVLLKQQRPSEAINTYRHMLSIAADHLVAHRQLGRLLVAAGDAAAALRHLQAVTQIAPEDSAGFAAYGKLLMRAQRFEPAAAALERALVLNPAAIEPAVNLSVVSILTNRYARAVELLDSALVRQPDQLFILNQLGWLLATCPEDAVRDGARALALARRACQPADRATPQSLNVLAAALAETGSFEEAVQTAESAQQNAIQRGSQRLANGIGEHLQRYRRHEPVRSGKPVH